MTNEDQQMIDTVAKEVHGWCLHDFPKDSEGRVRHFSKCTKCGIDKHKVEAYNPLLETNGQAVQALKAWKSADPEVRSYRIDAEPGGCNPNRIEDTDIVYLSWPDKNKKLTGCYAENPSLSRAIVEALCAAVGGAE